MIETEWLYGSDIQNKPIFLLQLKNRFKNRHLREYVVMPNHFHAILEIVEAPLVVAPNKEGQPQGIAPTQGIVPTDGIAPTQGIAPTNG